MRAKQRARAADTPEKRMTYAHSGIKGDIMNFDFSDDQKMLKEQVRKFLSDKCPMTVTRRVLEKEEAYA